MESVVVIFLEFIAAAIGWTCLFIWCRDLEKVRQVCARDFGGSYAAVTHGILLNIVAATGSFILILLGGTGILVMTIFVFKAIF